MNLNRKRESSYLYSTNWDVVVVGAGAAGLMTAIELPSNLKVLLLNRNTSKRSSSRWAQGGIAAVTRSEDSLESHFLDTINAGAGLCDQDAVRMFVENAPRCVERLLSLGMEFDKENEDKLATTLEAAHSHSRVLHVQDRTGRALVDVLNERVEQIPNVFHKRGVRVTQIWVENNRCSGVQVLDGPTLRWIPAKVVVLATGGGGHLFVNTTNPAQASGEGVALAWQAGAVVEDLEFFQFHPTALHLDGASPFLISEAVRGEGASLVDSYGNSPVANLPGGDLATRDQISRALFKTMHSQGVMHVGLDLSAISSEHAENRFPSILQRCRELGLDPLNKAIPVAPAAHYWMGGVASNLEAQTTVRGLYAVGEVACTGIHGANRLASNSLMECLVFAREMRSLDLNNFENNFAYKRSLQSTFSNLNFRGGRGAEYLKSSIERLREICWSEAGVDRSVKGMRDAMFSINRDHEELMQEPLLQLLFNQKPDMSHIFSEIGRRDLNLLLDLGFRQINSSLMLEASLFRKESRGGHFRNDAPMPVPYWRCHTIQKRGKNISTRSIRI